MTSCYEIQKNDLDHESSLIYLRSSKEKTVIQCANTS